MTGSGSHRGGRALLASSLLALVAWGSAVASDEVRVEASLDREAAAVGEQVMLTVTLQGSFRGGGSPTLPDHPDFEIYAAGSSQNFSWVNGQMSSSQTYSFVLVPRRSGLFEIGPVRVERGGKVWSAGPLRLTVEDTGGGARPAPPPGAMPGSRPAPGTPAQPSLPGGSQPGPGSTSGAGPGDALFLAASLSIERAYVNQEVVLSIRFYQRVDLVDTPEYTPPSLTGFWVEELPPQRTYREQIAGKDYTVTEIRTALFPTTPGHLTVGSARLRCQVRASRRASRDNSFDFLTRGIFDELLGQLKVVNLQTPELALQVLPLPSTGQPRGFQGAVGDYQIRAELDPAVVPAGEPTTVRFRIAGRGNVKSLPDVEIPPLGGIRLYDSESSLETSTQGYHVGGQKLVEKVLVPSSPGRYVIPPVALSFFSPERGYVTVSTDTLILEATASRAPLAAGMGAGGPQEIARRQRDIAHISPDMGHLTRRDARGLGGWPVAAFQIVPLLAVGGAWMFRREQLRREADPGYLRYRRAGRQAKRRLEEARAAARAGDRAGSCTAVAGAIGGYLGDRLGLVSAVLTPPEAEEALRASGGGEELASRVFRCLERCDLARFAPVGGEADGVEAVVREAEEILHALEKLDLARPALAGGEGL